MAAQNARQNESKTKVKYDMLWDQPGSCHSSPQALVGIGFDSDPHSSQALRDTHNKQPSQGRQASGAQLQILSIAT